MKKLEYKYNYFIKDEKALVIFPEKPFWFVGDLSILEILKYFYDEISFKDLKLNLKMNYFYEEDEVDEVIFYIEQLFDSAKLFEYQKVEYSDIPSIFPNVVINITKNCNLCCKHCYANVGKQYFVDEMKFEEIIEIIDIIIDVYSKYSYDKRILISGGEPFLRKDIINIIEYIHSKNFIPAINTNALLIKSEYLNIIKKSNCELLVSLDGAKKVTHENIRGKNTYYKTIEKIKMLTDYGIHTKLSMTVHKYNLSEVEGFLEIAKKYNVKEVAINPLNVFCRAEESGLKRVNLVELYRELKRLSEISIENFELISNTDYANLGAILLMNLRFCYCGVGSASLLIDNNGDIYPCYNTMIEEFKLGNIKRDNIVDIWNNSLILKKLRKLDVNNFSKECNNCEVKYYCGGGCRGEAIYEYNDLNSKSPYCKEIKQSILDLMFELSCGNNSLFDRRVKFFEFAKSLYLH